jgi:hypothetical protein
LRQDVEAFAAKHKAKASELPERTACASSEKSQLEMTTSRKSRRGMTCSPDSPADRDGEPVTCNLLYGSGRRVYRNDARQRWTPCAVLA